jgi:hypothetical protein
MATPITICNRTNSGRTTRPSVSELPLPQVAGSGNQTVVRGSKQSVQHGRQSRWRSNDPTIGGNRSSDRTVVVVTIRRGIVQPRANEQLKSGNESRRSRPVILTYTIKPGIRRSLTRGKGERAESVDHSERNLAMDWDVSLTSTIISGMGNLLTLRVRSVKKNSLNLYFFLGQLIDQ